ncbi:MAG: lysophospholipase [Propionibacteriaceae bacterium]|jgi:lysophospholipase|nr:lysophospholipase [Propionibacteriaceae bacterium]
MSKEFTFASFDGTKLFAKLEVPTGPKALVVIVHGLCEHLGRYDYLAARLLAQRYAVFRFDHRGHGRSDGERVYYSDFNEIVDDTNAAFDVAQREVPDLATYVIGHSMGGYAATLFGTKYPEKAAGIVLSGALTRYNNALMGPLPMPGDPHSYLPNELGGGVCSDPAVAEAYDADPLVGKQISIGLCNSFAGGLEYLKAEAAAFKAPALILHGGIDGLVAELDSRQLFGEISTTDKSLRIYAGLMHEIFNEFSKDEVIKDVVRWLNSRV